MSAVRIDGGEPVLEQHQLAVSAGRIVEARLIVECRRGAWLDLPGDVPLEVADLIWLAVEHRGQLDPQGARP